MVTIYKLIARIRKEIGLKIHPEAVVDCLPGVASYVGADISAGVLSSGVDDSEKISLFFTGSIAKELALNGYEGVLIQRWTHVFL